MHRPPPESSEHEQIECSLQQVERRHAYPLIGLWEQDRHTSHNVSMGMGEVDFIDLADVS